MRLVMQTRKTSCKGRYTGKLGQIWAMTHVLVISKVLSRVGCGASIALFPPGLIRLTRGSSSSRQAPLETLHLSRHNVEIESVVEEPRAQ